MSFGPALTPPADLSREMPADPAAQLDQVRAALCSLAGEQRRLEQLGFELPLARCGVQQRYWRFVGAVLSLPGGEAA